MRRAIAGVALVVLALVAAPRVRLESAPILSLPELVVSLSMPPSAGTDPVETTTRWIEPIESAIRSLGDVIATRGEIDTDSATITVRFRSGVDAELKTARLVSELATLRARLPRDARLDVWPSGESGARPSAYLVLTTPVQRIADELRVVPGVRDVNVYGGSETETAVRLDPFANVSAAEVRDAVAASVAPRAIGRFRNFAVATAPVRQRIEDVRVRGLRLGSIADVRERFTPATRNSRYNGKPAILLEVMRDDDVPLFTFARALRARARALGATEVWSEAEELRALLVRLAAGALVAMVVMFVLHRQAFFYIPIAIAIWINVARVIDARIDPYALIVAAIAIAGLAPLAVIGSWRASIVAAVFASLLPIAVALGSGRLAPLLAAPARAFAVAALCAIAAAAMVRGPVRGVPIVRRALRASVAIVLAVIASSAFLFSWFGKHLDPRRAGQAVERGRMYVRVTLPAGTTLAQTTKTVADLEGALKGIPEIARSWSVVTPSRARMTLELSNDAQSVEELQLLKTRLQSVVRLAPGSVTIDEAFGAGSRFTDDLEERPEADESGSLYRVVLKSTRPETLRRVVDEMERRAMKVDGVKRNAIEPEWAASATRIDLVPRPATPPETAARVAAQIAERTQPASRRRLPDGRFLRVIADGAPASPDEAPQRADLFARVFEGGTIEASFTPRMTTVVGRLTRELGRYILPVTVHVPGYSEDMLERRKQIDRAFATIPLPPGTLLERPSLAKWTFSREKLRLFALAAFLPLLLFAAAWVVLNSAQRAGIAAAPAVLGVACVAPMLLITESEVDEITLVAIAAALCCAMPIAVDILIRAGMTMTRTYRAVRSSAAALLVGALAAAVFIAIPASASESLRNGWRAPLVAAAVVLFVTIGSTSIVPAAFLVTLREAKRRTGRVARATRHPEEWRRDEKPTLAIASLTKTYASGFRALHQVSFDLAPGIIGLLGPNGAGKTTLLRTITGILTPTRGQVVYRGVAVSPENLSDYRHHVGFLPQEFNAYSRLTAAQFLDYWAIERGILERSARLAEIERLLAIAGLEAHANRRVRDFSGGMRQRIGIARALIGDPALLVVDEPTTGLDIEARTHFRELLRTLGSDRIVILSTHIASDVEATASRILVLVRGALRWDGTPDALIEAARGRVFEAVVSDADARTLSRRHRITKRVRTHDGIRIRAVIRAHESLEGTAVEPTLEEAYLAMVSEGDVRVTTFSFLGENTWRPRQGSNLRPTA